MKQSYFVNQRLKIIPIRWVNERHDTDRDGVPNWRDCNPWNPKKQGILHDTINTLKERSVAKQRMQTMRPQMEEDVRVTKHLEQQMEDSKQKPEVENLYFYAKMGDPRYAGGLRWYFVGGYDNERAGEVAREFSRRKDVYGVEVSERSDMENYLNRRDFKESAQDYVEKRGWKENIAKGLSARGTPRERSDLQRKLNQYKRVIDLEKQMGLEPTITHSSSELFNLLGKKRR